MDIIKRGVPDYLHSGSSRTKKIFGFIFVVLLLLILAYVLVFLLAYVFEDINLKITPAQKSLYLYQGEKENITFNITLKTNPLCMSRCETTLIDLSRDTNLSTDKLDFYSINPNKNTNLTKEFISPEFGLGQNLYNFKVRCQNFVTPFCMTHGKWYEKTALITLNYEFNLEKTEIKNKSKETLELVLNSLNSSDYNIQKTKYILLETLNKTIIDGWINSTNELASIGFASFKYLTDNLINSWSDEDYSNVIEKLDQGTVDQIFKLENRSQEILNLELNLIDKHNQFSEEIKQEENIFNLLYEKNSSFEELNEFYILYKTFSELNFTSYDSMENLITFNKFNLNSKFHGQISEVSSELNQETYLRCNLKGFCKEKEKTNDISTDVLLNKTCDNILIEDSKKKSADNFFAYNYATANNLTIEGLTLENAYNLIYIYLNIQNYLQNKKFEEETTQMYQTNLINAKNNEIKNKNSEISHLNNLILNYNALREKANILIKNDGSQDVELCNNLTLKINQEKYQSKKEILLKYSLPLCNFLVDSILSGQNGTNKAPLETIMNLTLYEENLVADFIPSFPIELEIMALNLSSKQNQNTTEFYNSFCVNKTNENKILFNLTKVKIPLFSSFNQTLKTRIDEPIRICCVFGKCTPCCIGLSCYNNSETYPVLLIHGHEFNRANSPEYSLESLNGIQKSLEDNGYVNAGVILPTSSYNDVKSGEWGISGIPIVIKLTYYYGVYGENGTFLTIPQASENIGTYANRLNYIIELIKYRTGKDKVNIVAHSMGGLVARKYLQEYGEDNVYKFIMIGTPNKGLVGDVDNYCSIFGEEIECNEMKQNSTFLNALNEYIPKNKTNFYAIVGIGCKMNGFDGDGITPSQNVLLKYSENYFINGTCPNIFELLHSKMLDTSMYPAVSSSIKNILKS